MCPKYCRMVYTCGQDYHKIIPDTGSIPPWICRGSCSKRWMWYRKVAPDWLCWCQESLGPWQDTSTCSLKMEVPPQLKIKDTVQNIINRKSNTSIPMDSHLPRQEKPCILSSALIAPSSNMGLTVWGKLSQQWTGTTSLSVPSTSYQHTLSVAY